MIKFLGSTSFKLKREKTYANFYLEMHFHKYITGDQNNKAIKIPSTSG